MDFKSPDEHLFITVYGHSIDNIMPWDENPIPQLSYDLLLTHNLLPIKENVLQAFTVDDYVFNNEYPSSGYDEDGWLKYDLAFSVIGNKPV